MLFVARRRIVSVAAISTLALAFSGAGSADAAQLTWTGAGTTTSWSDAGNWGGTAITSGDSLVFDGGTAAVNVNDLAAGTNIAGITWAATSTANWSHTGAISNNLSGNLTYARGTGSATITTPFVLQQNINIDVAAGGTLNFNGAISGGFSITKTGGGLAVPGTAMTHTGGLSIAGGTYRTNVAGNTSAYLGTGTVTLSNDAALELRTTGSTTFNNALDVSTGGGKIDFRSNHFFNPTSITGSGLLTLRPTGADNLIVTSANMQNWNGTVALSRNGRNSYGLRLDTLFVGSSLQNAAIQLSDNTFVTHRAGTNQPGTSVIEIGAISTTGTLTTLPSIGGSATGTGYFVWSIGNRNENSVFAGNVIAGSSGTALRKVGTGTLELAGPANSFASPSAVNAGKLVVSGSLTAPGLALTVNSGATLGGSGTIAGTVSSLGGTIAPGASPGTLTVGGMTLNGASVLNYELNGGNTTVGGGVNDLISVGSGGLTLDGTINISETVAGSFATAAGGSTWRLFNVAGTLVDSGLSIGTFPTLPAGGSLSIDTLTPGQVNIVLTVPEPTSLLVLGAAGLIAMKRRR